MESNEPAREGIDALGSRETRTQGGVGDPLEEEARKGFVLT
jgi:hypothetical protein